MKVTLTTLTSRYGSIDALNANFEALADAIENTLSRDGTGPNALEANVDANSYRIINLPDPLNNSEPVTLGWISDNYPAFEEVSDNLATIETVANSINNVNAVGSDLLEPTSEINTVAVSITNVNAVGNNITNVNTLAAQSDNIDTLVAFTSEIEAVIANETDIDTVSSNIGAVQTLGSDLAGTGFNYDLGSITDAATGPSASPDGYIITLYNNLTDIQTLAALDTELTVLGAIDTAISGVYANTTNINTVAGISSNVTTVAGIAANVTTVATNNTNVSTVATNIADVNTVATNIVDVQNAEENADAAIAAKVAAEAARDAALAALDSFDDRYLGQKTSDPSVDNDGNALVAGALYFNTTTDTMLVYEGSVWVAAYASLSGALLSANNLSDLTNASTARTNLGLGALATLSTVGTTQINNQAVTADKLAATLDLGTIA
jgi:hypothetical protein